MKRLLATLLLPAAILLTSCSADEAQEQSTPAAPPSATSSSTPVSSTDPAFLGGCSAISIYIQQRVQNGEVDRQSAGADFLQIVDKDPSYQAMSETEKQVFRQGIEAGAAGSC